MYLFIVVGQEIFECERGTHFEICKCQSLRMQALRLMLLR
jgi:hypothetical protein